MGVDVGDVYIVVILHIAVQQVGIDIGSGRDESGRDEAARKREVGGVSDGCWLAKDRDVLRATKSAYRKSLRDP